MSISIGSNSRSLGVQRSLAAAGDRLSKTFEKLSSGLRVNRASDDAAGLAVSSNLKVSSLVFGQAIRNVNDGISYCNIGAAALDQLSDITMRQTELAEQSANGVYSASQRKALTAEANALVREYNRIVQSTGFNGRKLFDLQQSDGDVALQAGYGASAALAVDLGDKLSRVAGSGSFSASAAYSFFAPLDVTVCDMNNDGKLDMVAAGSNALFIYQNQGCGTFQSPEPYTMFESNGLFAATGDLNNDGCLDLIASGRESGLGTGNVAIRLSDGSGGFQAVSIFTGVDPAGACGPTSIADVNGDGFIDIATACSEKGAAAVLLNRGNGTFSAPLYSTFEEEGSSYGSLEAADINGDGATDLIWASRYIDPIPDEFRATLSVRLNDGRGNFMPAVQYKNPDQVKYSSLAIGDLNGDTMADIALTNDSKQVLLALNNGDGSFQTPRIHTIGDYAWGVMLDDFNSDGLLDILTSGNASTGYRGMTCSLNRGDGSFGDSSFVSGPQTLSADAGDVNNDGAMDIIAVSGGLEVCLGTVLQVSTIASLDLNSAASARRAIDTLNAQLNRITSEKGNIGSFQSRLSIALEVLGSSRENFNAAVSRITDADVAEESAALLKNRIIQQAASSILAQANQEPQIALTLLQ